MVCPNNFLNFIAICFIDTFFPSSDLFSGVFPIFLSVCLRLCQSYLSFTRTNLLFHCVLFVFFFHFYFIYFVCLHHYYFLSTTDLCLACSCCFQGVMMHYLLIWNISTYIFYMGRFLFYICGCFACMCTGPE